MGKRRMASRRLPSLPLPFSCRSCFQRLQDTVSTCAQCQAPVGRFTFLGGTRLKQNDFISFLAQTKAPTTHCRHNPQLPLWFALSCPICWPQGGRLLAPV